MSSVTIYKNVDIDVEIDLDDVGTFIDQATNEQLKQIAEKLAEKGVNCELTKLNAATVTYLINRANTLGLDEMLNELKSEGFRCGALLNIGVMS